MADLFRTIGVVGAGAMGRGIAQVAAQAGAQVTLSDISAEAAEAGRNSIGQSLARAAARGRLSADAADAALARITPGPGAAHHAGADLVIEAAAEALAVKARIFAELAAAAPDALLATNTSSLAVAAIAQAANTPLIGLHFFNPAHVMPLVEVILPPGAERHMARLEATLRHWGKTPVAAPDTPGFIVNRVARPFYGEALAMLEQGADPAAIDSAMRAAGYKLGPFALIDLVGADVHLAATETVSAAMDGHPRYHVFDALRAQVAAGKLGRKSGTGFVTPEPAEVAPYPDAVERIEATLVNEAATLLDTGAVTPDDIDTAMRLGLNFPRGPFEILRATGVPDILSRLAALEAAAPPHLAGRYRPAPALTAMENA